VTPGGKRDGHDDGHDRERHQERRHGVASPTVSRHEARGRRNAVPDLDEAPALPLTRWAHVVHC
jgi:hypothetical protein